MGPRTTMHLLIVTLAALACGCERDRTGRPADSGIEQVVGYAMSPGDWTEGVDAYRYRFGPTYTRRQDITTHRLRCWAELLKGEKVVRTYEVADRLPTSSTGMVSIRHRVKDGRLSLWVAVSAGVPSLERKLQIDPEGWSEGGASWITAGNFGPVELGREYELIRFSNGDAGRRLVVKLAFNTEIG